MSTDRSSTPCWGLSLRLILLAGFFTFLASLPLWQELLSMSDTGVARLVAMGALALGLNLLLMALVPLGPRPCPSITLLMLIGAALLHFGWRYGVALSPQMMHNTLGTDTAEIGELLTASLGIDLVAFGLLPAALLHRLPLGPMPTWPRALTQRLGVFALGALLTIGALVTSMSDLAPLNRENKALRYRLAPGNLLVSSLSAIRERQQIAGTPLEVIDANVLARAKATSPKRRRIVVMVIGETVRAANWGLAGYDRQTTPELASRDDLLTAVLTSCGTDTATSLPCMFSDIPVDDYDRRAIATRENLLDVARRAGVSVQWREAQAGCKGVCDRVPTLWLRESAQRGDTPYCEDGVCRDMALLNGLTTYLDTTPGDVLLVLHQMGNHGPGYWRRAPDSERHYEPVCTKDDLSRCDSTSLINAYDNAVRYTDRLLYRLIGLLERRDQHEDLAMLYVSDHGESLGEHGLYLHGMPRWMAPVEQTRVPLVLWLSAHWRENAGLVPSCAAGLSMSEASHDHLFHTVIGLLGVRTKAHDPQLDLLQACRTTS